MAVMAASKTRKDRQRERRRKRSESAGRLFEQALVELTDDGGPPDLDSSDNDGGLSDAALAHDNDNEDDLKAAPWSYDSDPE